MSQKKARSSALLSELPPSITLSALYATALRPRVRRTLQVRGPILLLSKQTSTPDPAADRLLLLSSDTNPQPSGNNAVSFSQGHKFWFETSVVRDAFLTVVRAAVRRVSNGSPKYSKLKEIGYGPSATVHLVKRNSDAQLFAMKSVSKHDVLNNESKLAAVITERIVLAEAIESQSAFVLPLVDAFETHSRFCFVTQLAQYGDLYHVLGQIGKGVEEGLAKKLFAEMVLGLEEVHRMGYLYRDMTLQNLLVTDNGHVKLSDFGLAKRLQVEYDDDENSVSSESGSTTLSDDEPFRLVGRTTSFVGSRQYMSPEHLKGARGSRGGYGAPADVWALGIVLYYLVCGKFPFGRKVSPRRVKAMFDAIAKEEIKYGSGLSEEVVGLLRGMLERDVRKRFDINRIKTHEWLKDVDWEEVRSEAAGDLPQEDVLDYLMDNNVGQCGACKEEKDCEEICEMALVEVEECPMTKKRKMVLGNVELLGFGFCEVAGDKSMEKLSGFAEVECSSCSSLSL